MAQDDVSRLRQHQECVVSLERIEPVCVAGIVDPEIARILSCEAVSDEALLS